MQSVTAFSHAPTSGAAVRNGRFGVHLCRRLGTPVPTAPVTVTATATVPTSMATAATRVIACGGFAPTIREAAPISALTGSGTPARDPALRTLPSPKGGGGEGGMREPAQW